MINVFQPTINEADILAVTNTLQSGWIGRGEKVQQLERMFANYIGVDYDQVVSINSCTEALFLACEMLDIEDSDVIIPSIHFVGAANAVLCHKGYPSFCDVDSRTLNPTLDNIKSAYTSRTVGVILLHYGGVPCADILSIRKWCKSRDIWLIEDSACSLGATLNGQHCGTFGDIGVWSFDAMKLITTGDGGMMYFADPDMAQQARLRTYLGTDSASGLNSDKTRWWEFEVKQPARRSIMNDVAASLGISQMDRIREFRTQRLLTHFQYDEALRGIVEVPPFYQGESAAYFYWIQTPQRDALAQYLRANGIYVTFRYYPLHWVFRTGDKLPGAEKAANETLLLPLHCGLSDSDVGYVCGKVRGFYAK